MPFPSTRAALEADGYKFVGHSYCTHPLCKRTLISWFETPNGKRMPMTAKAGTDELEPHWASCPGAARFRKPKP